MKYLLKPTPEVVNQAVARLGKTGAAAYFFDRLDNPEWIEPLRDRGFFSRPPGAIRNPEEGTISFPDWPELRYLLRMARSRPAAVGPIVLDIPETENVHVHELIVQIGALLPGEFSAHLADKVQDWLKMPLARFETGEHLAKFIAHLANQNDVLHCKKLASTFFSLEGASPAMDSWHLDQNLAICLPSLRQCLKLDALSLLQRFLLKQMHDSRHREGEDYSYIWRQDLAKGNFPGKEAKDIFIDAIVETARDLAKIPTIGFDAVCRKLLAGRRPIFRRVAIYIAAELCDESQQFVAETLIDGSIVDRPVFRAEYGRLLQAIFPRLKGEFRARLIAFLTTDFLRAVPVERRDSLGKQEANAIAALAELHRLQAFGEVIPAELAPRRDFLLREMGDRSTNPTVWRGPTSPLENEQLQRMPVADIVAFLRSWEPTGTFGRPSPEGLCRALQGTTAARAQEFSNAAAQFIGLAPTYVRAVVTGLADVVSAKQAANWEPVLILLKWVCSQPVEVERPERTFPEDSDPGWSWTRLAIVRLLENGLKYRESGLAIQYRQAVWEVLDVLSKDPDPPCADGSSDSESDYLTRSINSVRGLALHTIVRYAWWIHSEVHLVGGNPEGFDRDPEIRKALEASLRDGSPAVRCVLGEYLPSLFYFDPAWTAAHVDEIFPATEQARVIWAASWGTYVDYAQPYDAAFSCLRPKYDLALERLGNANETERKSMGEHGLGQHLASYFWRAVEGDESTQRLLLYFDRCDPQGVGHILWFLRRGLDEVNGAAQPIAGRLTTLWSELRVRSAAWTDQKRRELNRHFGTWFTSEQFDAEWALGELERCLGERFGLIDVHTTLGRMAVLARPHPERVARCLELLVSQDQQLRYPFMFQTELGSVLKVLLEDSDPNVRQKARGVADKLVEGGNLFARDLVTARQEQEASS